MRKILAIILTIIFAVSPCYAQWVAGGGGGGSSSLSGGTQYYLAVWNGTDSLTKPAALGSAGNPLVSGGAAAYPTWLSIVLAGGTNTFSITNGTASLDVAAGATLNIDTSLQVATAPVVIHGKTGFSSTLGLPLALSLDGTLTDGKACTYTESGTIIHCNSTFLAPDGDGSSLTGLQLDQFTTQTAWRIFYSNGDGDIVELALGTDGYLLKAKGAAAAPEWSNTFSAQIDDSAAQFKHADSTATGKIDLQSVTADKGFTLTPVCTDNCVVTTPSLGSGTFTAVIIGQTLVTRTEFIPVAWMIDGAAAPAALATTDLGTRQVKTRAFQGDTADQDLEMYWQAPNDIVDGDGGTAGFQVKWRPIFVITSATAPASGEGVALALQSCSSGNGDTGDCTVGTASVIADADLDAHAQFDVVYGGWTAMTVTDGAAGEAWFMKLYRDQDNAIDDYAQPIGLVGIELKYQTKPLNDY